MRKLLIATAALAGLASPLPAVASYTATIAQVGANVVASGTGTLNTTALSFLANSDGNFPFLAAGAGRFFIGLGPATDANYVGVTGPSSFGTGLAALFAGSATGDMVGIQSVGVGTIFVPDGYSSGASLTSTATWDNKTLSSLGLTAGNSTWTWGTGATADSFTINISAQATPAPEAASVLLLLSGLFGLGLVRWWGTATLSPAST